MLFKTRLKNSVYKIPLAIKLTLPKFSLINEIRNVTPITEAPAANVGTVYNAYIAAGPDAVEVDNIGGFLTP